MLTAIEIEGFKSFGHPGKRVELSRLSFLAGPNACGKSNFVSALRFLQCAIKQDFEYAVAEFGGIAEVRSKMERQRREAKSLRIRVDFDDSNQISRGGGPPGPVFTVRDHVYSIEVDLRRDDEVPVIVEETYDATVVGANTDSKFQLKRSESAIEATGPEELMMGIPKGLKVPEQERSRPALNIGFFMLPLVILRSIIERWAFFNVSPHVVRQSYREVPDATLGLHGENLSVVLHKIEAKNGQKRLEALCALLRGVVPGFKGIKPIQLKPEPRWGFTISEDRIASVQPISVSDGTIRLLTLTVIAELARGRQGLTVIEEPENGVHPHVMSHLVDVLRDASEEGQFIATTHNPAFLDLLEPHELLLCGKIDGTTRIRRADSLSEVESFRKHFNLGELWVQGTFDGLVES